MVNVCFLPEAGGETDPRRIVRLAAADAGGGVPTNAWWAAPGWSLLSGEPLPAGLPDGATVIVWSGTLAGAGEGLWEADPRTWGPVGRQALDESCKRMLPEIERRGIRLCIRPHARHVLSDGPSINRFANAWGQTPLRVLPDPLGLLTRTMLPRAEEHLERLLTGAWTEAAGPEHRAEVGMVLANIESSAPDAGAGEDGPDDGPALARVPLHRGEVAAEVLRRALRGRLDAGMRIWLVPGGADEAGQRALLADLLEAH